MAHGFDAVSLDVGGVLVVPDHGVLRLALASAGVGHDASRFGVGHYLAMAALDRAAADPEDFTDYLRELVLVAGVPEDERPRAVDALTGVLVTPTWCQPVPGSREALRSLAAAGLRLSVTSNSDGNVADHLRRHEWVQVGDHGPGVPVEVITDSGNVGVGKPDPRVFQATIDGLGLPPERILHVGDSVHFDVAGAAAVGMQSVHMDPFGVCDATDHEHVRALVDVLG